MKPSMDAPDSAGPRDDDQALMGRFHLATLVMHRGRQLANGARPRIERDGHKYLRVALAEVLAGTVSWSLGPAEGTAATTP